MTSYYVGDSFKILTFDAPDVVADILVESVGVCLLEVEVLEVLVEDVVCRLVRLAQVLEELQREIGDVTSEMELIVFPSLDWPSGRNCIG